MAFKLTPGIKGNPSMNRIKNLGACGGPGQPPCEPRFQKEVEEKRMRAIDRSSSSISKSIKPKIKEAPVKPIKDAPVKPAPAPKLRINLPEGYEFGSKRLEVMFFAMFEDALENGKYKTQEELDMAIMKQLKKGEPVDPKDPGVKPPLFEEPGFGIEEPGLGVPIKVKPKSDVVVPVKGVAAKIAK